MKEIMTLTIAFMLGILMGLYMSNKGLEEANKGLSASIESQEKAIRLLDDWQHNYNQLVVLYNQQEKELNKYKESKGYIYERN